MSDSHLLPGPEDSNPKESVKEEQKAKTELCSPQQQKTDDLSDLLSLQSAKEREERSQQDEIFTLLSKPTAREQSLLNTFKSADGGGVKEFCQHSTKVKTIIPFSFLRVHDTDLALKGVAGAVLQTPSLIIDSFI